MQNSLYILKFKFNNTVQEQEKTDQQHELNFSLILSKGTEDNR